MGSSNIQVWNPTFSNQETDSGYTADSLRAGGAQTDDIMPSPTFNKFGCNVSSPIAALCQALASKGYTISDSNYSGLVSVMANIQTTADLRGPLQQVSFSTNPVFDCSKYNGFNMLLSGNVTALSVINATPGQLIAISFTQNSTGGFTVPWPSNVLSPGTVAGTANKTSGQLFQCLSDNNLHPLAPMTVS